METSHLTSFKIDTRLLELGQTKPQIVIVILGIDTENNLKAFAMTLCLSVCFETN